MVGKLGFGLPIQAASCGHRVRRSSEIQAGVPSRLVSQLPHFVVASPVSCSLLKQAVPCGLQVRGNLGSLPVYSHESGRPLVLFGQEAHFQLMSVDGLPHTVTHCGREGSFSDKQISIESKENITTHKSSAKSIWRIRALVPSYSICTYMLGMELTIATQVQMKLKQARDCFIHA